MMSYWKSLPDLWSGSSYCTSYYVCKNTTMSFVDMGTWNFAGSKAMTYKHSQFQDKKRQNCQVQVQPQ